MSEGSHFFLWSAPAMSPFTILTMPRVLNCKVFCFWTYHKLFLFSLSSSSSLGFMTDTHVATPRSWPSPQSSLVSRDSDVINEILRLYANATFRNAIIVIVTRKECNYHHKFGLLTATWRPQHLVSCAKNKQILKIGDRSTVKRIATCL